MATKSKTIKFGKGRRWLNPRTPDCKAGVIWHVDVCVYPQEEGKDKAYLEAYLTTTEESQSHWVYKRGDIAPLLVLTTEVSKFRKACLDALAFIEEQGYDYSPY